MQTVKTISVVSDIGFKESGVAAIELDSAFRVKATIVENNKKARVAPKGKLNSNRLMVEGGGNLSVSLASDNSGTAQMVLGEEHAIFLKINF